jgi:uncharacterized SAM-binding protein YcdF (DUF218 family)
MFLFGKIVGFLLLPPGSIVALFALALLFGLFRKSDAARRWSAACVILGAVILSLGSLGPFSDFFIAPLEREFQALAPLDSLKKEDFKGYDAIVVLGSGAVGFSPEEGRGSALSLHSEKRVSYAFRLSRRSGLPIVFTGGKVFQDPATEGEAQAVARYLAQSGFDPGALTIEDKSVNTWENASFTYAKFKEKGIAKPKLLLVTSAFHMPRAMLSFRKNGMEATAAPTDYCVSRGKKLAWFDWMPAAENLEKANLAGHEYLGRIAYLLKPAAKDAR